MAAVQITVTLWLKTIQITLPFWRPGVQKGSQWDKFKVSRTAFLSGGSREEFLSCLYQHSLAHGSFLHHQSQPRQSECSHGITGLCFCLLPLTALVSTLYPSDYPRTISSSQGQLISNLTAILSLIPLPHVTTYSQFPWIGIWASLGEKDIYSVSHNLQSPIQ